MINAAEESEADQNVVDHPGKFMIVRKVRCVVSGDQQGSRGCPVANA